jgi:hypothetical protein
MPSFFTPGRLIVRMHVAVRRIVKEASGKDLLSSFDYRERAWKWACVVFRQAVGRCRARVALQETLMELAAHRMFEYLGQAAANDRHRWQRDKKAQGMLEALQGLAPEDAMRVVGFLDGRMQARAASNVLSLEQALRKCNLHMLKLLTTSSSSRAGLATSILGGNLKIRRADVMNPLAKALEEALAQGPMPRLAKGSPAMDPLLAEAAHITELKVPGYLSSSALTWLLSKGIISAGLEEFDALRYACHKSPV